MISKLEQELQKTGLAREPNNLYEPISYTMDKGGKRVRPLLVFIGNGMCGGIQEDAVAAAKAVEMLHNFTLIHDDIMDKASTRRGFPTVYKKWDINTAILSGDALFTMAMHELLYYGNNQAFNKQEFNDIFDSFLNGTLIVCEGQARDMIFETTSNVTIDAYIKMISEKTAALLSTSLILGGITAHANEKEKQTLADIGYNTGVAFQIQDDYLDAFGTSDQTGKKKGGDIFEGKKTWLYLRALQKGNQSQLDYLSKHYSDKSSDESTVTKIIELFEELDLPEECYSLIQEYYSKAIDLIQPFTESESKEHLQKLLEKLSTRNQ